MPAVSWSPLRANKYVRSGIRRIPLVHRCLGTCAATTATIPWQSPGPGLHSFAVVPRRRRRRLRHGERIGRRERLFQSCFERLLQALSLIVLLVGLELWLLRFGLDRHGSFPRDQVRACVDTVRSVMPIQYANRGRTGECKAASLCRSILLPGANTGMAVACRLPCPRADGAACRSRRKAI